MAGLAALLAVACLCAFTSASADSFDPSRHSEPRHAHYPRYEEPHQAQYPRYAAPTDTVKVEFQARNRRLCSDNFPASWVQYGLTCDDDEPTGLPNQLEVGSCDFTSFVTVYIIGNPASDTVPSYGNFFATCSFAGLSLGDNCGDPLTGTTALSIQGTISGVLGGIISSLPPFPTRDEVCITNDAQPRLQAPSGDGSSPWGGVDSARNATARAHVAAVRRQRQRGGEPEGYSARSHLPNTEIGGYRVDRVILFRGHVTALSPDPLCTLEDGYFEFPIYALNFDPSLPPVLTPVSKAEAAAERVFDPYKVTVTFKTRQGPRY